MSSLKSLARDRPKALAKIYINHPVERSIGNKGMHLLCKALRGSKGMKKAIMDVTQCSSQQLRVLAKWLKTSRNIKSLELNFPLNPSIINQGVLEMPFYLKNIKSLEYLGLWVWNREREELEPHLLETPSFVHFKHLQKLQKLRVRTMRSMPQNIRNNMVLPLGIKGLSWLSGLDLDCSFFNCLRDREIQRFTDCLKEIQNLTCLRLDFRHCWRLREIFLDELAAYVSSLEKLESFHLESSVYSNISSESLEKLIASLKNNSALKTIVLLTPRPAFDQGQIQCLNIKTFHQLTSLKLSLSSDSPNTSNNLLRDLTETMRNSPGIQTLDLKLFLKLLLNSQSFNLFCQSLGALKNLTSLTFSLANVLESSKTEYIEGLTACVKALRKLTNLYLNLNSCVLSNKSVVMIAESIDFLQDLKTLVLDLRYPKGQFLDMLSFTKKTGLGSFGPVFQRHKNLSEVTLLIADMKPSSQETAALASGIGSLKTLTRFVCDSFNFFCSDLKDLERSFATTISSLTCLNLELKVVEYQDMEALFGILQGAKKLESLDLIFGKVVSLSEKAAENFIKMIKALVSLRSIKLQVMAEKDIETKMILRFLDAMKYCHRYVDFSTRFNAQDQRKYERDCGSKFKIPQVSSFSCSIPSIFIVKGV